MTQRPLPKDQPTDPWPAEVTPLRPNKQERARIAKENESSSKPRESERARATRASRALPLSARALISWLTKRGIYGSEELVRRYGTESVLEALYKDGIVLYQDEKEYAWKPRPGRGRWVINPKWRSPGGFLITQLRSRFGTGQ